MPVLHTLPPTRPERILVVDDERTFSFPATYARTSKEGLAALEAYGELDELWLDHDLGMVDGAPDTVMPVAHRLLERAVWGDPFPVALVVVHSANPPAAEALVRSLGRFYTTVRVAAHHHLAPA